MAAHLEEIIRIRFVSAVCEECSNGLPGVYCAPATNRDDTPASAHDGSIYCSNNCVYGWLLLSAMMETNGAETNRHEPKLPW